MLSGHHRTRLLAVVGCLVVAGLGVSVGAQKDPRLGTWKLNVAKSKSAGKIPLNRSQTLELEAAGSMSAQSIDGIGPNGEAFHWGYTAALDGKDVPITGKHPEGFETASRKLISATTVESTYKKGGKVASVTTSVLSADGKTLTITNTNGNVTVYDKQ